MSRIDATRKPTGKSQQPVADGRVFKFSLEGVPPVDAKTWAQMKAAARLPSKDRRYPEIAEAPDASV